MSQPFIGEIRMFAGNFAPVGWAFCNGQLVPISENDALFNLIGTTYGGDGQQTFGLPDLQSRVPVHQGTLSGVGQNFTLGEKGGTEQVTLTVSQIPAHNHVPRASSTGGDKDDPTNNFWANSSAIQFIDGANANTDMNSQILTPAGGSQPHDNMLPFLCVNFIISLFGIFPQQ